MLRMNESSFEFERKKIHNIGFPTYKLSENTWIKIFYDSPFKYYFDEFGIRLLGYKIEFSCLYIPHGHFISTLWL